MFNIFTVFDFHFLVTIVVLYNKDLTLVSNVFSPGVEAEAGAVLACRGVLRLAVAGASWEDRGQLGAGTGGQLGRTAIGDGLEDSLTKYKSIYQDTTGTTTVLRVSSLGGVAFPRKHNLTF